MGRTTDLYRDLCSLSKGEFGEVLDALGDRRRFVTEDGDRASKVQDILTLARKDAGLRQDVEAALARMGALGGWALTGRWLEAVEQACRSVPIVGAQDGKRFRMPIDDIYVPLALSPRPDRAALSRDLDVHDIAAVRLARGALDIRHVFALLEQRIAEGARLRGVAVIGDPGSGKSTLLKHLFCGARRGRRLGLPTGLTPLLLRFIDIAPVVMDPPRGLLLPSMIERAARQHPGAGRAVRPDSGPFLFLLDGLDEVSDEATRVRVAEWLDVEMESWAGSRFVVSCRKAAWRRAGQELHASLLGLGVLDFGWEDIRAYVRGWFKVVERDYGDLHASADERAERAERGARALLEALSSTPGTAGRKLRDMAGNPLLLSNICLLQYARGRLPQARVRLYQECLDLLLQSWARHQGVRRGLPPEDTQLALAPVAWAMQAASDGRAPTELARQELVALLAERLPELPDLELSPEALLDRVVEDCGVLVESDVQRYRFPHLTFQEYLAALDAQDRGAAVELAERAGEPRWREPILLAMGLRGMFRPFMEALLERPDIDALEELLRACLGVSRRVEPGPFLRVLEAAASDPHLVEAAAVVLRVLRGRGVPGLEEAAQALTGHPDLALRAQARSVCGLSAERVDERPPADPHPGTLWRAPELGLEFVWVPAGGYLRGATLAHGHAGYDPVAEYDESPPHRVRISQGFWLGRFPVTVDQYQTFVEATGAPPPDSFRDSELNQAAQPVSIVDWHQSRSYCLWLGAQLGAHVDLPTEAEWEWAARGDDGRSFPWGEAPPEAIRANFRSEHLEPVGGRPLGRGPFNAEEQAGGVWEWCLDVFGDYPRDGQELVDPCLVGDGFEAPRVLRGGSWYDLPWDIRSAYRHWFPAWSRDPSIGFRVVCRFPRVA
ncbi:MAG: SUMF1/EgtB/PvdO family nonheme iron enzyme [Alphaproteobacteria bacterium]|nr:SUMF1/EgtB/PvdO family nonheme iron enzyme [Alphaproteobacteria bacterium]